jgi:hypothetical protein
MTDNKPKRKRGAQPGNTNALKHGFYSHRFNNLEISDLNTALSDGLTDEIALLRVIIRRVFEYADTDAQDLEPGPLPSTHWAPLHAPGRLLRTHRSSPRFRRRRRRSVGRNRRGSP